MRRVALSLKSGKKTFGPFDFVQFDSIQDAVDFYKLEEAVVICINKGSLIGQQSAARVLSLSGKSSKEISEALQHHRPRLKSDVKKARKSERKSQLLDLIASIEDPVVVSEAVNMLRKAKDFDFVIQHLREKGYGV